MLKKYKYDELMIEITRKCNMKCAYCLRGDAQNVTMSKEVIDKIFEDAVDCKQVLFTGGEPLLALDEIEYFIDKILKSNWTTKNIAMTINGMIRDKRLIDIVNRFCQSKEERTFYVFVSEDEFHDNNESKRTLEFYQKLNTVNGVFIASNKLAIGTKQAEFTLAGRAIEYYKNHPQLDSKWSVRKEEQTNHRLCILDDRIPCAMYVTALGGFESYVGEEFSTVDRLSYGSILKSSMSELIEMHNNDCVISCHDAYLINYFNNLAEPNNVISKLCCQINMGIINRFVAARETARKLYPFVSAYDIIMAIPMPDLTIKIQIYNEILLESEHLSDNEIKQYVDAELINYNPEFENLRKAHEEFLQIFALLKKPNSLISPNRIYGSGNLEETLEFKKLAALNQKYADGLLNPDNSINIQCAEVYGKSFRDYEVEKIQNSDLPAKIKMSVLRKDELLGRLSQELESECKKFFTGFIKDLKEELPRIVKNPNDNLIFQFRAKLQDTINDLKVMQNHIDSQKAMQKLYEPQASADQTIHPAIKTADGLRCGFCSKVIQYQGRNIHCAPVEGGLQCQYCKKVNTV